MALEKIPEKISFDLEADRDHAQILIEITDSVKSLEEMMKVVEGLGVGIAETKRLSPDWVLIKLDVMDMRDVALKLIENGFLNIKGINASATGV